MSGFLDQIKRKKVRTSSMAADLLLQSSTSLGVDRKAKDKDDAAGLIKDSPGKGTSIVTASQKMGEADSLLNELMSEGTSTRASSPTPAANAATTATRQSSRTSGVSRVRVVSSG